MSLPQQSPPEPRPYLTWIKGFLIVALVLFTITALPIIVENGRGRQAWDAYLAKMPPSDSLDVAAVIPPPVPDEQNMAAAPIFRPLCDYTYEAIDPAEPSKRQAVWNDPKGKVAFQEIRIAPKGAKPKGAKPNLGLWMIGEPLDMGAWQKYYQDQPTFPQPAAPQSPPEDVLLALGKFEPLLSDVQAASMRPLSRFPLHYEDGIRMEMPHIVPLLNLSQALQLRATAALQAGKMDAAFTDTQLGFRLAESISTEPMLISALVRMAILQAMFQPLWEGMESHRWSEGQLQALASQLAGMNLVAQVRAGLVGERNRYHPHAFTRENIRGLIGGLSRSSTKPPAMQMFSVPEIVPAGWLDQNRTIACRISDRFVECVDPETRKIDPVRLAKAEKWAEAWRTSKLPYGILASLALGENGSVIKKAASVQGFVHLACIAIALERHFRRHDSYPESLDHLDGDLLSGGVLPTDPASGAPVHYKRLAGQTYCLYFEGWNLIDDGGLPANGARLPKAEDMERGDWIWFASERKKD